MTVVVYVPQVYLDIEPTIRREGILPPWEEGDLSGRAVNILDKLDKEGVTPLSIRAALWCLSHELFLPSTYATRRIEDKGSLAHSLQSVNTRLFDRGEKFADPGYFRKITAFFARAVASQVIGLVVAPIGLVYHFAKLGQHTIQWLRRSGDQSEQVKRIQGHAYGILIEFVQACVVITFSGIGLFSAITAGAVSGVILLTFFLGLLHLSPITMTTFPRKYISGFSGFQEGLYKSLTLREDFGITNKEGSWLTWDSKIDSEFKKCTRSHVDMSGFFTNVYLDKATEFVLAFKELQQQLRGAVKLPFSYPPRSEEIISSLKDNLLFTSLEQKDVEYWKQRLESLEKDRKEVGSLLGQLFASKYESGNVHYMLNLPDFPLSNFECGKILAQ